MTARIVSFEGKMRGDGEMTDTHVVDDEQVVEAQADDFDALEDQHMKAVAVVPDADEFEEGEYLAAGQLRQLAKTLCDRHDLPGQHFNIAVLWKKKGGMSKGKPVWGQTQKVTGLLRYYAGDIDFVITISANHAFDYEVTNYQLEAMLFHELLHIGADVDENGVITGRMVDHDIDGFTRDVVEYGTWAPEHRRMKHAFTQARLIPDGYIR